ncbi:NUDIX domain-containing protein [Agromyces aerolatus]|uniref:NUDIX domain-containing protein n=1 Tax=Agromyces sp. LY-1074 TaxID=3074080 RepID=UPI0028664010|nr:MULTISPECIES: NUDIX domain-containing protein [unclassified Agromyces]MDR5699688.1 NUDIX domain-containing protein [Agromyces sp. LY-1074]MDR5705984.1 NUDIX domain-containing protein [Agromyces sp. LY-1358]
MPVVSAGLLLVRRTAATDASGAASGAAGAARLEVFIAHMGGPFWARKREGAWSIPKGEFDPSSEDALAAARREFAEELGVPAPEGEPVDLGEIRYGSGKRIRVFALEAPAFELAEVASNTFELEWPPRSGRRQSFPEIDEARWTDVDTARPLLVAGQRPVLDAALRAFP